MSTPLCTRDDCNQPAPTGRLCRTHRTYLTNDLAALPGLIRELETTTLGQATTNGGILDLAAAEDAWVVGSTLRAWCVELAAAKVASPTRGFPLEGPAHPDGARPCDHPTCARIRRDRTVKPLDRAAYWAAWLHGHLPIIDRQPWAGDMAGEVEHVARLARRAVDARQARLLLGACSTPQPDGTLCEAELWARSSDSVIQCPRCPALHEVAGRRTNLLELSEDLLLTAAEIAHAVPEAHGVTVSLKDVSNWAARSRIVARGVKVVDGRERVTYRLGDVLDVARATATRRPRNDYRTAA